VVGVDCATFATLLEPATWDEARRAVAEADPLDADDPGAAVDGREPPSVVVTSEAVEGVLDDDRLAGRVWTTTSPRCSAARTASSASGRARGPPTGATRSTRCRQGRARPPLSTSEGAGPPGQLP
jgi:hypothetical protein